MSTCATNAGSPILKVFVVQAQFLELTPLDRDNWLPRSVPLDETYIESSLDRAA